MWNILPECVVVAEILRTSKRHLDDHLNYKGLEDYENSIDGYLLVGKDVDGLNGLCMTLPRIRS